MVLTANNCFGYKWLVCNYSKQNTGIPQILMEEINTNSEIH